MGFVFGGTFPIPLPEGTSPPDLSHKRAVGVRKDIVVAILAAMERWMPLRAMDREQMWLMPPSLGDLIPAEHPSRFVAEVVDALDREDWRSLGWR